MSKLTRAAVLSERQRLLDEVEELNLQLEENGIKLRMLRRRCPHVDRVHTTHMGDPCYHCYDCGLCP